MSRIEASKMEGVMVSSSLLLLSMMSVSIQYLQIVLAEQEGMTTYIDSQEKVSERVTRKPDGRQLAATVFLTNIENGR
jgi:hypothetical protein